MTPQSEHAIQLHAKKKGTATITLWNDEKQFAAVQVTVLVGKPADDSETTETDDKSGPVQFFLPHQTTRPAEPPQGHASPRQAPRPAQPGQGSLQPPTFRAQADAVGQADGLASRTGQIDVASLGTAIIEAKGEIELASNDVQSLRRAQIAYTKASRKAKSEPPRSNSPRPSGSWSF